MPAMNWDSPPAPERGLYRQRLRRPAVLRPGPFFRWRWRHGPRSAIECFPSCSYPSSVCSSSAAGPQRLEAPICARVRCAWHFGVRSPWRLPLSSAPLPALSDEPRSHRLTGDARSIQTALLSVAQMTAMPTFLRTIRGLLKCSKNGIVLHLGSGMRNSSEGYRQGYRAPMLGEPPDVVVPNYP